MMYFKLLATSIIVFAWKHENARSDEKAEQGKYKYKITSVDKTCFTFADIVIQYRILPCFR